MSIKIFRNGGHRLFDSDPQTDQIVSEMLRELERDGMDAVRKYSQQFDDCSPEQFELSSRQIQQVVEGIPD